MAASARKRLIIAGVLLALLVLVGWLVSGTVRAWHHHRKAQAAIARRDFSSAREQLRRCLLLAPTDADYLLLAGQTARRTGDFTEADRLLERAFDAGADAEAVRAERVLLRLQSGDLSDSERAYNLYVEKPDLPGSDLILEALIVGSLRAMHLPLARRCIDLWLQRDADAPARVQGLIWRGDEAIRHGSHENALADYREALSLDPASDQARQRAAEILIRVDASEAREHLTGLLQRRPDDPELLFLLARCHRSLGEHEEARRLLDGLLTDRSRNVAALIERGQVELDLRQTDEAERWFRSAEALAPELREPNLALARCLQVAGKDEEARKYRERVDHIDAELQKRIDKLFNPSSK